MRQIPHFLIISFPDCTIYLSSYVRFNLSIRCKDKFSKKTEVHISKIRAKAAHVADVKQGVRTWVLNAYV